VVVGVVGGGGGLACVCVLSYLKKQFGFENMLKCNPDLYGKTNYAKIPQDFFLHFIVQKNFKFLKQIWEFTFQVI
jgi:hypothetical protein